MTRPELSTLVSNAIADRMRFGPIERHYIEEHMALMSKTRLSVLMRAIEAAPCKCGECGSTSWLGKAKAWFRITA